MYSSPSQKMAVAVTAVLLTSSFDLVEAIPQQTFKLNRTRANRLTKNHQMNLRRQNKLHDGHLGEGKKMIYPQSLSHKVSKWLGLYGTVANTAGTSETITSDSDFLDLTWAANLLIGDANTPVSVIFDTT